MIIFKDFIIKNLPNYVVREDSYKDIDGKGFIVRFLEIFGMELDEYFYNKLEALPTEFNPLTASSINLEYFAAALGDLPRYLNNDADFARVLTFIISIYQIKGTIKSYKSLLTTLGYSDVTITEALPEGIAYDEDPPIEYDNGNFYDDNCVACSGYDIYITTTLPVNGDVYQKTISLVSILEPINAILGTIFWNGDPITAYLITVEVDVNGDLVYNNDADPGLILTLVNGDLIIDGPNADKYYLENGDLYFVII